MRTGATRQPGGWVRGATTPTRPHEARKSIHLTVGLTEEDAELIDLLRLALGGTDGDGHPLSHARVVRMALRHLGAAWGIREKVGG
jgi:hypothetical protein